MANNHSEHLLKDEEQHSIFNYELDQNDGNNADYHSLGREESSSNMSYQRVGVKTNPPAHTGKVQQPIESKIGLPQAVVPSANDGYGMNDNLLVLGTPNKPKSYAPWTPKGASLYLQDKFQAGSIKGSIFTLIICIVGAGALSLPWAFRYDNFINILIPSFGCVTIYSVSGLLLGSLLLLLASGFTFLSLHFLVYSGLYIKERPSYRNLALAAGGKCLAV